AARRYRNTPRGMVEIADQNRTEDHTLPSLPLDYLRPIKPETGLPRPLAPSGASALMEADEETPLDTFSPRLGQGNGTPAFALRRGTAIHMLLQCLPDVPRDGRDALARGYLDRIAADWPETERQIAWQSVRTILDDPTYAPVF